MRQIELIELRKLVKPQNNDITIINQIVILLICVESVVLLKTNYTDFFFKRSNGFEFKSFLLRKGMFELRKKRKRKNKQTKEQTDSLSNE